MKDKTCPSCGNTLSEDGSCKQCDSQKQQITYDEIDPFSHQYEFTDEMVDEVIPFNQKESVKKGNKSERTGINQIQISMPMIRTIIVVICILLFISVLFLIIPGLTPVYPPSHTEPAVTPEETPVPDVQETIVNNTGIIETDTKDDTENITENKSEPSDLTSDISQKPDTSYEFYDFSDPDKGPGVYNDGSFLKYYDQGMFHIIQKGENMTGMALLGKDYTDVYAQVETSLLSGPLTGSYGLLFRDADGDWYSFGINGRGWYSVKKQIDGKSYELIPDTEIYLLNKGYANNTLGIGAEGSNLQFYINGRIIREITDTSLSHGDVGLFVSRHSEKGYIGAEGVHVAFDNLKVK